MIVILINWSVGKFIVVVIFCIWWFWFFVRVIFNYVVGIVLWNWIGGWCDGNRGLLDNNLIFVGCVW